MILNQVTISYITLGTMVPKKDKKQRVHGSCRELRGRGGLQGILTIIAIHYIRYNYLPASLLDISKRNTKTLKFELVLNP